MEKLISHRGNLNGRKPESENHPDYIYKAISWGFDCEIDVWADIDGIYLGHDKPSFEIDYSFLLEWENKLWIHCKNIDSYLVLSEYPSLNLFAHQNDDFVITTHKFLWSTNVNYHSKKTVIMSLLKDEEIPLDCYGVCSDYIVSYVK